MKSRFAAMAAFFLIGLASLAAVRTVKAQNVAVSTIHAFDPAADGSAPRPPTIGPDGNLYGTTFGGSAGTQFGTVYQMTPAGVLTLLHAFDFDSEGSEPSSLVLGGDGAFYGTTPDGGTAKHGTIFRVTLEGGFTILYSFSGVDADGGTEAPLALGADGNLYGTTYGAGESEGGTLFSISPDGAMAVLHTFSGAEGTGGFLPLLAGQDGAIYGLNASGGTNGFGSFYRYSTTDGFVLLHAFSGGSADGAAPFIGGLIPAAGDAFYCVGYSTADYPDGTLDRLGTDGSVTIVHVFDSAASAAADGSLILGGDGNFYGESTSPGAGSIFRLSADGSTFTTLYTFTGSDGSYPDGNVGTSEALVAAGAGDFYGVTQNGGIVYPGGGTLFRASLYTVAVPVVSVTAVETSIDENSAGKARVVVRRDGDDLQSALDVRIVTRGTAVNGVDYKEIPSTVTIPAGSAKARVKIFPADEGIGGGGSKTVVVKLKPPTDGSYTVGSPKKATVTIVDND